MEWRISDGSWPTFEDGATAKRCTYGAPLITWPVTDDRNNWTVRQANCNHWDCPRCGPEIAKKHYGRIVEGARQLAQEYETLWFITITCRGAGLSRKSSEAHYLEWTNRLLTNMRTSAKRAGLSWHYVQVTERQKRGHPHSHMLTGFQPADLQQQERYKVRRDGQGARREYYTAWRSEWMQRAVLSAGLGREYDISLVRDIEAASRYVAKYLFKDTALTKWPDGWRRIRYSQSWPKLPEQTSKQAFPLLSLADYDRLEHEAKAVTAVSLDEKRAWEFWLNARGRNLIIRLQNEAEAPQER